MRSAVKYASAFLSVTAMVLEHAAVVLEDLASALEHRAWS